MDGGVGATMGGRVVSDEGILTIISRLWIGSKVCSKVIEGSVGRKVMEGDGWEVH
jgi:hypothetical protein